MGAILVSGLFTYPIKSCAGIPLQRAALTAKGFELDRQFMLVDEDGDFLSQRKVPELALVLPALTQGALTVRAPGMETIEIPLESEADDSRLLAATIHGKPVRGQLLEDELSEWFTEFLPRYRDHRRYRLLRVRDDAPRYINERYRLAGASNRVGFADGSAILLASEPSLAQLNTHLDEPVPMNRFRPNIVVDGPGLAAYDEDHWLELQIGGLRAFVTKPCDRCVTTDVNQATASTGKEVRRALRSRRGSNAHDPSNTGVFFAQNLNHVFTPGSSLGVGDRVDVLGASPEANVVLAGPALPGRAG